jgi:probable F420-dependent oxidoreductase
MKVRIGVAVGGRSSLPIERFGDVVDQLDELGFDSIWLPETFLTGSVDPLVGLAYTAARVRRLKLGTHLVTPGRNPYALAKALAQLDRLSGGRLLLTFVAGVNDPAERAAQGLPDGDRTTWFDEHLPRIRRWWVGEEVEGLTLDSNPLQEPLEVWLGGKAPKALTRVGRLGDGWLPGGITLDDAVAGRLTVDAAASAAGRTISDEHFGINLSYAIAGAPPVPAPPARVVGDTRDIIAPSLDALPELVGRWVDAGFTKLVVRPTSPPDDWSVELGRLADAVVGLQT